MRLVLSILLPLMAVAQDEHRVASPDGQTEFRIFVAPQEGAAILRIAYQVFFHGKAAIETSFLAIDIWTQEPMLGEATGLIGSHTAPGADYNALTMNYMQNGSLGRLLNVEARVFNDGVAFRYVIPGSTPLRVLQIADEATEFALPVHAEPGPSLPFVFDEPGIGWVEIAEVPVPGFPRMHLVNSENNILLSRLAPMTSHDGVSYEGTTPFTYPWRVIALGATREAVLHSAIVNELSQ
jgi:alpha-glucosidase